MVIWGFPNSPHELFFLKVKITLWKRVKTLCKCNLIFIGHIKSWIFSQSPNNSFPFNICTDLIFMSHNTFSPLVAVLFQSLPIIFASWNIILQQILDDLKPPCTSRTYHYTCRLQYLPTLIRETYIYITWWSTQDLQLVKVQRIRDCTVLSSKCNIYIISFSEWLEIMGKESTAKLQES